MKTKEETKRQRKKWEGPMKYLLKRTLATRNFVIGSLYKLVDGEWHFICNKDPHSNCFRFLKNKRKHFSSK